MNQLTRIWRSSPGKKYVMAISGGALLLFVIGHLIGNLQVFLPPEAINRYGHFLQTNLEILWPARIALLILVLLHILSAIRLTVENRAARPVAYTQPARYGASYASRTMLMSGLVILAFIIYHLLHYTALVKAVNLTGVDFSTLRDGAGRHDVYAMLIYGFSQPLVACFYIVAMALLCLHLSHGFGAMFQSLGWKNSVYGLFLDRLGKAMALAIFIGYTSIPIAVMLGHGADYLARVARPTTVSAPRSQ